MNQSNKLTVTMSREELLWGWIYFPFYVALLGLVLDLIFQAIGWDVNALSMRTRMNGVFFAVNFLAVILIFHRFLFHNLLQIGKRFWGFVQAVILSLVMYFVGMRVIDLVLLQLLPEFRNVNDAAIFAMAQENRVIILVGTVLLAPVAEECMFRGLIFRNLHKKNRILAYAVTTLAFSLIHVLGYVGGDASPAVLAACVVQYIPAGIALGWAYERADSIFAPMAVHCCINAIGMQAML